MLTLARTDSPWTRVTLILLAWAAIATAIALSGALPNAPRPFIPIVLAAPIVAFFVAARRPGLAREVALRLDLRVAIGYHVLRAPIGAAFLVAMERGALPAQFAVAAGWGDIVAGLGALAALAALPARTATRRRLVLAWNLVALGDIVMVVAVAQSLILRDLAPPAFLAFPFPLLPLFIVPVVFITHGIVFWRLRAPRR